MKKIFLIMISVFLVSCGIDTTPYKYPDEGREAEGEFVLYDKEVKFYYPESWKVKEDANIEGKHYSYTIKAGKKGTSVMHLNARKVDGIKQASSLALNRQSELSSQVAIERDIAPFLEKLGYKRFFVSNIVQEKIGEGEDTIYMTKCVIDLDPERVLISFYDWGEEEFYCTLKLMSYERDFMRDNPRARKLAESFSLF